MGQRSFDHIASNYDASFTNTSIGRLQRKSCWNYVEKIIPELPGTDILELNCGTGEDSVAFGKKGFRILATDISTEMLKVAENKVTQSAMNERVELKIMDLYNFDENIFGKKFDLIFSNFGGFNCIEPIALQRLLGKLALSLNPGGRLVAVIMPQFCLWESLYFILKFKFRTAFRRWTNKKVNTNLSGAIMETWYYNPYNIKQWLPNNLCVAGCQPVGLFLPPSYLEKFFSTRKKTLQRLNYLEGKSAGFQFLSPFADHYLIDLRFI